MYWRKGNKIFEILFNFLDLLIKIVKEIQSVRIDLNWKQILKRMDKKW